MDPSHQGAPSGRHQAMSLDDVHDTASARKNFMATFGAPSPQTTVAGTSIPTLPSPEPDISHPPQHPYNVPIAHWTDGQRPPTPPLHHLDDVQHYPHQRETAIPLRGPQEYTLLPQTPTATAYTSSHGTFLPAHGYHQVSNFQSRPIQQAASLPPRLHPSASMLQSSPQQQTFRPYPTHNAPSIQHWPTHNLMVDAQTRKKQEAYKRKGEAARRKTISSQGSAPQYAEPTSTPRKRKAGILNDLTTTPTPSRHVRRFPPSASVRQQEQQESFTSGPVTNYYSTPQQPLSSNMDWSTTQRYHFPSYTSLYPPQNYGSFDVRPSVYAHQHTPHTPTARPPPPKIVDPESVYQPITKTYDDYRWPVVLYQLQPEKGFDFAELLLQTQLDEVFYKSDDRKWDAHTTTGFIKDGNRLSLLVLHNAANPFEWDPPAESTTSIGVYGLYAHNHNEIHWTTVEPSISEWFSSCVAQGFFTIKQKWLPDMKASDKRFHRAYWLAANRLPLNRILNHNIAPEKPYGMLEDEEEDGFAIAEGDLQHGWEGETISAEESKQVWERLVDEVEGLSLLSSDVEHMPIGGSERKFLVA
jgi:hypothetical protein